MLCGEVPTGYTWLLPTETQIAKHIDYLPSSDPNAKKPSSIAATDVHQLRDLLGVSGSSAA